MKRNRVVWVLLVIFFVACTANEDPKQLVGTGLVQGTRSELYVVPDRPDSSGWILAWPPVKTEFIEYLQIARTFKESEYVSESELSTIDAFIQKNRDFFKNIEQNKEDLSAMGRLIYNLEANPNAWRYLRAFDKAGECESFRMDLRKLTSESWRESFRVSMDIAEVANLAGGAAARCFPEGTFYSR